jgi:hypothetical protein
MRMGVVGLAGAISIVVAKNIRSSKGSCNRGDIYNSKSSKNSRREK